MKKIFFACLVSVLLASCSTSNNVKIYGQFVGENERLLLVEKLYPTGGSEIVDSVYTDEEGSFSFSIKNVETEYPSLYQIRTATGYLMLLISAGEKIHLSSVGNISNNYTVEGSVGSAQIKSFFSLINKSTVKMDSIYRAYSETTEREKLDSLGLEYERLVLQRKRDGISFIVNNASSLAAIIPLYFPMSDATYLIENGDGYEIFYFKQVSDSLSKYYPNSPFTRALKRDVERVMGGWAVDSMLYSKAENPEDFPDIEMTSSTGKKERLSSYKGKIIILSFTASTPVELKVLNRELQELYNYYRPTGKLVVYQVSIDTDKYQWLQSVTQQDLKWINVCDFNGIASPTIGVWNVTKIPSNFLISPSGEIVGKNLTTQQLKEKIDSFL